MALPHPAAAPRSGAPWAYRLARPLVRAGLRLFYRRVVVHTLEHVPPRGPAVFAATHPNSVTDALVLGASIPRPLRYVAHSGLFRRPVLGWLLPRCGVIPVYRPEDFPGPVDNRRTFAACVAALGEGEAIGIFPEGTSHRDERVRRLRTGAARMALEAEARAGFALGVELVPVGLNFQAPGRFRSDVLVLVGPPLAVPAFGPAYRADPVRAAQALTAELQRRLEALALELPAPDLLPLVRRTLRLLRDTGASFPERVIAEHGAARAVGEALAWAARDRPGELAGFGRRLEAHTRARRRLGLTDAALARAPQALAPPPLAAVALPLALAGAAAHALPYRLTAWVTRRLHPDPTKEATVRFCAGAALFGLTYAAFAAAAWLLWGLSGAGLCLALIAAAGWLALRWLPAWRAASGEVRLRRLALVRPGALERLRAQRAALADEARRLWDAFSRERPAW